MFGVGSLPVGQGDAAGKSYRLLQRLAFVTLFIAAVLVLATARSSAQSDSPSATPRELSPLETLFSGAEPEWARSLGVDFDTLRNFYLARDYRPLWDDDNAGEERAALAYRTLMNADEEGLDPEDYHAAALAQLGPSADTSQQYELLLTDGLLRYARDVNVGRARLKDVDKDISLPPRDFDAPRALNEAVENNRFEEFLSQLPPPHPEYVRLREMLKRYRALAEADGWETIPQGFDIEEASEADLALLHRRLAAEDSALSAAEVPDSREELLAELKRYQSHNGLDPDGVIGPQTLGVLNASAAEKATQIAVNMERWRWLPREFEERFIMVNTADATLVAVRGGRVEIHSRVIVGRARTRTPMLRTEVVSVTVNPPWNVPRSIAVNEMLPRLRDDPAYLQERHISLVNGPQDDPHGVGIDWNNIQRAGFPYMFRQAPGPDAALGFLKLEMPSPFSVYLHDTPSRSLFTRATRTLSHGCIRVEQIRPLSSWVLSGDDSSAIDELQADIADGQTKSLPLPAPIPVYVLYWTAGVNADGTMGFRPDVYGRDRRLIEAM